MSSRPQHDDPANEQDQQSAVEHRDCEIRFVPLTSALEDYFDKAFGDLPDELRQRVMRSFLIPWDSLSAVRRRSVAIQSDYQNDPAIEQDQRRMWELNNQIAEWEAVATPTAVDLATKETRLASLRQELASVDARVTQHGRPAPAVDDAPVTPDELHGFLREMQDRAGKVPSKAVAEQQARKAFEPRRITRKQVYLAHKKLFGKQPPGPRVNSAK